MASQTRPDISFEVLELSCSLKDPQVQHILQANKCVKNFQEDEWKVTFPNLGRIDPLKLIVFSDASHANLPDGFSSAGSFVIFLVGQDGRNCPLSWQSKKIQRVVKSTIATESLAMVKATDMPFYLAFILKEILLHNNNQLNIPVECCIDNHSL